MDLQTYLFCLGCICILFILFLRYLNNLEYFFNNKIVKPIVNFIKYPDMPKRLICDWQESHNSSVIIIADNLNSISGEYYHSIDSTRDAKRFSNYLCKLDSSKELHVIIHTNGGDTYNAKIMLDALVNFKGKKIFYVPHKALSSGTMLLLPADEIHMCLNAYVSPIDTQITISETNINQLPIPVEILKDCKNINPDNLVFELNVKMAERDFYADHKMLEGVLKKFDTNRRKKIITNFLHTKLPHSYPISLSEAREFGLSISTGVPPKILEIFNLL